MSDNSPRLDLPYIQPAQAQKHVTHNEALRLLDVLVQLTVAGFDATTPPALPLEGEVQALGTGATGDWAGHDGDLAVYVDGAWQFHTPQPGWVASLAGGAELRIWTGSGWDPVTPGSFDNLAGVGVNTTSDATNRLAVSAPATLLSHEGSDHRLKINKAATGDTASLLFQSGWSGRAELGLAGSDDFSFKVSPDGSSWTEALAIDAATGRVSSGDTSMARLELAGTDASLADLAVDLCIYDTGRDSDGGAWRQRCQSASWYRETLNTAARGARREFPAVVALIAEASALTAYDADDPSVPMWKAWDFSGYTITSVAARDGKIVVGLDGDGVTVLNLVADEIDVAPSHSTTTSPAIVNDTINDIAVTARAGAAVDPATGLPVPTIAVATNGGVSVINDDGTVADSASSQTIAVVDFNEAGDLLMIDNAAAEIVLVVEDYAADGFAEARKYGYSLSGGDLDIPDGDYACASLRENLCLGGSGGQGLVIVLENPDDPGTGARAQITSGFNTGLQFADTLLCALADTDAADLVADTPLDEDFTSYADQPEAEAAGWSFDTGWAFDAANDRMDFDAAVAGAGTVASASRSVSVTAGASYVVEAVISGTTNMAANEAFIKFDGNNLANPSGGSSINEDGTYRGSFVASSSSVDVQIRSGSTTDGDETFSVDSIQVWLADTDRSVKGNGLVINGTVTRRQLDDADGLVACSGGTDTDFLQQPYNADLDFGTAAFEIQFNLWQAANAAAETLFERNSVAAGAGWKMEVTAAGLLSFTVTDGTTTRTATGAVAVDDGIARHVACGYDGAGGVYIKVDGFAYASATGAALLTLDNTAAVLNLFRATAPGSPSVNGEMNLFRPSATPLDAPRLAFVVQFEAPLRAGAACTLHGSSDAVTALAHDPVTGLLHVGTSAGRSVFHGLNRIDNTSTAVSTAIAALGGLIVEQ